jgi:ABC-type amino acid transport substrate-binding protein
MIDDKQLDLSRFALMIPPGEYQFQQYLDVAIQSLKDSGKLDEIIGHWIDQPANK